MQILYWLILLASARKYVRFTGQSTAQRGLGVLPLPLKIWRPLSRSVITATPTAVMFQRQNSTSNQMSESLPCIVNNQACQMAYTQAIQNRPVQLSALHHHGQHRLGVVDIATHQHITICCFRSTKSKTVVYAHCMSPCLDVHLLMACKQANNALMACSTATMHQHGLNAGKSNNLVNLLCKNSLDLQLSDQQWGIAMLSS